MRLGVMQPYFFPYLGHFSIIAAVDRWVVFDITQYTPKTWMNRNRILHPKTGWQYVTVPLSNSSTSISTYEAKVLDLDGARRSIIGKLSHYKRKAPYFQNVEKLVSKVFDENVSDSLVCLNVSALCVVCEYLGISFEYQICSELDLNYPVDIGPGGWAPYICEALGADEYVNPSSGASLFNTSEFSIKGIDLYFSEFSTFRYETQAYDFESNLSILDVMMWNSPEEILAGLENGTQLVRAV